VLSAIVGERPPDVDLILRESSAIVTPDVSLIGPGVELLTLLGWHQVLLAEHGQGVRQA
jgi:hypothetical protein